MNFAEKGLVSIVGKVIGAFIGLISGIILARLLGPEALGQYQLLLSSQTIIITLFSLGIGNASIYYINSGQLNQYEIVSTFTKLFIPLSIVVAIIFSAIILTYKNYFGDILGYGLLIFTVGTASLIVSSIFKPILYAEQKIIKITFLNTLPVLVLLIGLVIGLTINIIRLETALTFFGIGNLVTGVLLIYHFRKDIKLTVTIPYHQLRSVIIYGGKLAANNLVFVIYGNLVIFFIKLLLDDGFEAVGVYSRAVSICSLVLMIPMSVGPLLFSRWSGLSINELKPEVEKALRLFILLSIVLSSILILSGDLLINILYGKEYLGAFSAIVVLAPTLIFYTITEVVNNLLASIGKAQLTLYVFLGALLVITILSLLLIPIMHITGAALSILGGAIFNAVGLLIISRNLISLEVKKSIIVSRTDIYAIYHSFTK